MKASQFKDMIERQIKRFGDHPIAGGYISDDSGVERIIPLDKDGCETLDPSKVIEYFIE